jgi:hypothetical protein
MGTRITIDEEFKALVPPLTAEELAGLRESLTAEGCRDALVLWQGVLLDGHNRYEICTSNDIPFDVTEIALPGRDAAKAWIVKNQLARRNLTPFQRAELAIALEASLPSRQGKRTDRTSVRNLTEVEPPSRQAAKLAGVSHDTYTKAKHVHARADDEIKAKLRSGETSINREHKRLVQTERQAQRVASVEAAELPAAPRPPEVVENGEGVDLGAMRAHGQMLMEEFDRVAMPPMTPAKWQRVLEIHNEMVDLANDAGIDQLNLIRAVGEYLNLLEEKDGKPLVVKYCKAAGIKEKTRWRWQVAAKVSAEDYADWIVDVRDRRGEITLEGFVRWIMSGAVTG